MQLRGLRILGLFVAVLMVFGVVVAIGLRLLPGPHTETDYLVVGSVATFIALGVLFVVLITSYVKSPDVFFKRRDKA
jgi:cytochrome c oxidase assembly factor CtaG